MSEQPTATLTKLVEFEIANEWLRVRWADDESLHRFIAALQRIPCVVMVTSLDAAALQFAARRGIRIEEEGR